MIGFAPNRLTSGQPMVAPMGSAPKAAPNHAYSQIAAAMAPNAATQQNSPNMRRSFPIMRGSGPKLSY